MGDEGLSDTEAAPIPVEAAAVVTKEDPLTAYSSIRSATNREAG